MRHEEIPGRIVPVDTMPIRVVMMMAVVVVMIKIVVVAVAEVEADAAVAIEMDAKPATVVVMIVMVVIMMIVVVVFGDGRLHGPKCDQASQRNQLVATDHWNAPMIGASRLVES
jgi:hypothetical protein